MKASMMLRKAVIFQKRYQFHVEGNMLPMAPKPPRLLTPSAVKIYFRFPT